MNVYGVVVDGAEVATGLSAVNIEQKIFNLEELNKAMGINVKYGDLPVCLHSKEAGVGTLQVYLEKTTFEADKTERELRERMERFSIPAPKKFF